MEIRQILTAFNLRDCVRALSDIIFRSCVWRRILIVSSISLNCWLVPRHIRSCNKSGNEQIIQVQSDIFANVRPLSLEWVSLRHVADKEIFNPRACGKKQKQRDTVNIDSHLYHLTGVILVEGGFLWATNNNSSNKNKNKIQRLRFVVDASREFSKLKTFLIL